MASCGFSFELGTFIFAYFQAEWSAAKFNGWFGATNNTIDWTNRFTVINKG